MESRTSPGKKGSVQPISGSRVAFERHCSWGYLGVSAVAGDNPAAVSRVWLVLSSPAYPREPCRRRGFSGLGFPSPAVQQGLCR